MDIITHQPSVTKKALANHVNKSVLRNEPFVFHGLLLSHPRFVKFAVQNKQAMLTMSQNAITFLLHLDILTEKMVKIE